MTEQADPQLFTLEEANALLPVLEPLMRGLQETVRAIRVVQQELERLGGPPTHTNGHQLAAETRARELRRELERLAAELESGSREVQSYGCELKDPESGLLDFRSLRDGRVVYLCWRLGEGDISHWHDLDTGFAGRQPI